MPTFSETIIEVWNVWEIRALLLLSLSLQVILVALGSVRKRSTSTCIRIFVWSAYMSADSVATVALGILSRKVVGVDDSGRSVNTKLSDSLQLFWTPFLILHLGGPDTITAYSLEDNELWPRHFLGFLIQTGAAVYVLVKSWGDDEDIHHLKLIAIPVFVAGIIKYGERTLVLWTSSTKSIRNSLLSDPDPGPEYPQVATTKKNTFEPSSQKYSGPSDDYLSQAYYLFNRFKYLFADLILGYHVREDCHSMISGKSSDEAFELVEGELGLLYDVLYTKATLAHSLQGLWFRCLSFFLSVCAMTSFSNSIDHHSNHFIDDDPYLEIDISITYLLLVGAIAMELYGLILFILSDWTKLWLAPGRVRIGKRWSRTIMKYSLIKFCLKQETLWTRLQKFLGIEEMVEKHLNVDRQDVNSELKKLIFEQLKERSENMERLFDVNSCKKLLSYRGDGVLDKMKCLELLKWSTIEVEFDHSLLLWHIATQLCYYDDVKRLNETNICRYSNISKCLSGYMLYLVVMYPNMLPKGIGEMRYRDTCAEAIRFFRRRRRKIGNNKVDDLAGPSQPPKIHPNHYPDTLYLDKVDEACYELYEVDTAGSLLEEVKGDKTESVLFYGCRLAKQLQSLESQQGWECVTKWDMINKVWVELLAYAAVHCGWREHGQQLRRGGELLTHVCLLMAHLGLSEQYRFQKENFQIRDCRWLVPSPYASDPCFQPLLPRPTTNHPYRFAHPWI